MFYAVPIPLPETNIFNEIGNLAGLTQLAQAMARLRRAEYPKTDFKNPSLQ